jgi:hypothetical protein
MKPAAKTYTEIHHTLTAEFPGVTHEDIDATIESLIDAGIEYADEEELYLTDEEIGVLRDQLTSMSDDDPGAEGISSIASVTR